MHSRRSLLLAAALVTGAAVLPLAKGYAQMNQPHQETTKTVSHPYLGMWVTSDRRIRHNLLPNGRYDEARGTRENAYQGRYEVTGNEIFYWDDTGFTADGTFIDGVLHHGGMIFHRE